MKARTLPEGVTIARLAQAAQLDVAAVQRAFDEVTRQTYRYEWREGGNISLAAPMIPSAFAEMVVKEGLRGTVVSLVDRSGPFVLNDLRTAYELLDSGAPA